MHESDIFLASVLDHSLDTRVADTAEGDIKSRGIIGFNRQSICVLRDGKKSSGQSDELHFASWSKDLKKPKIRGFDDSFGALSADGMNNSESREEPTDLYPFELMLQRLSDMPRPFSSSEPFISPSLPRKMAQMASGWLLRVKPLLLSELSLALHKTR